jgi:hypothetical protein
MVAGRLDGCLARRIEQCILNENAPDEAELKPVLALGSSLVTGRIKSSILEVL